MKFIKKSKKTKYILVLDEREAGRLQAIVSHATATDFSKNLYTKLLDRNSG